MTESLPNPECHANGNHCPTCLRIAQAAMRDALVASGQYTAEQATPLVENSDLRAPLEEAAPLAGLSCTARQRRAEIVGNDLAKSRL